MLRVNVTWIDGGVEKIEFVGHAMYDDYGKDIVCSAASSILITTVNGILSFDTSYLKVEEEKDHIVVSILVQNEVTRKLIQNMLNLLSELETQYPENIKIS